MARYFVIRGFRETGVFYHVVDRLTGSYVLETRWGCYARLYAWWANR